MHKAHREVFPLYLRFLQALLGVSEETVHSIRFQDPLNREHMSKFPEGIRTIWEADPCPLAGVSDPEVIFRMGEDTRSCMGIRPACSVQNKALLGYLLQGNVRLVGVQSAHGRMEARAVLRLLLRSDDMTPALYMDKIYYASHPDSALEEQVLLEAESISKALHVPLYQSEDKIPKPPEMMKNGFNEDHPKVCDLLEVNGLSDWVYSDGAIRTAYSTTHVGLLYRKPFPDCSRQLELTELQYVQEEVNDPTVLLTVEMSSSGVDR
ncbi:unnamed protein product [Choristocarpus tenellus]